MAALRNPESTVVGTLSPRRAIEVVALFEDAIVETRHFDDPRAGGARRSTRALLGAGAAALAGALLALFAACAVAARERATGGAAVGDGAAQGSGLDLVALALVAGGLAALVVGLMRRHEERGPRHFTVGPDPRALFPAPAAALPVPAFPLLHSTGDDFELMVTEAMQGEVEFADRVYRIDELVRAGRARPAWSLPGAFALPLPEGARARVEFGDTSVVLRPVPAPERYPVPIRFDRRTLRSTSGAAVVAALALATMFAIPPDPKLLALENMDSMRRIHFTIAARQEPTFERPTEPTKQVAPATAGRGGRVHKGPPGKMGDDKSRRRAGLFQIKGPAGNRDPQLAKELARTEARNAGVLGMLNHDRGSRFASIFSSHDSAIGDAARDVLGGLIGTDVGPMEGVPGALGLAGTHRGGDWGNGLGTVGLERIGTVGVSGDPHGYGRHVATVKGLRHPPTAPEVIITRVETAGMDKEIIRRVVRRHINEIKFCYEQALSRDPDLYGRLVVQFSIGGTGRVLTSVVQSSTMANATVEQCTLSAVRRWEFPQPERSGLVLVTYPFTFNRPGAGGADRSARE